jgi:hypothetical protein
MYYLNKNQINFFLTYKIKHKLIALRSFAVK